MLSPVRISNNSDNSREPRSLHMEATLNIKWDTLMSGISKLAKDFNQNTRVEEVIQPPYEGANVMLKVNYTWITSNSREPFLRASHNPTVEKYFSRQFD